MKTLVVAKHAVGPAENGADGCHARWGENGMCPGVRIADWLNAMGEDEDIYLKGNPAVPGAVEITCGQVRENWLRNSGHIVAVNKEQSEIQASINFHSAGLRRARRRLRELTRAAAQKQGA